MKNKLIALIGLTLLIFSSCSNDKFIADMPSIPDSFNIDIEEDGIVDYQVQFDQPTIDGSNNVAGLVGRFLRYGKNEILHNNEERNLFLRNLEEIEENVIEPLIWRSTFSSTTILSITSNAEGKWPTKWNINSNTERSSYFLGFKMIKDNGFQLAWIEFEINTSNGNVLIINKGII